jgi:branched-chain amino acid transport system substrate-binding protein
MKRAQAVAALSAIVAVPPLSLGAQGLAPYKIGVTFPLTGPFAPTFADYLKGGVLGVEDVNAAGGVEGHKLQLVIEDSLGTPQGGIAAMRKVTQVDGVQCIFTILTNVVTAQIPLADEIKVPTMSLVETPGLFAKSEYSFAHAPTWGLTLPLMVTYWKAHGVKRAFGMLTNNAIGVQQSAAVREAFASIGVQYDEALIEATATDFRGTITRARELSPEIILITGQGGQHEIAAIKEIREMGMRSQIWNLGQNFTSRSYREALGPYSEGLFYGGVYLDPKTSPKFAHRYAAAVGYPPAYNAGEAYDIMRIYAAAIAKTSYKGTAIRDFVASLHGMPSVLGGTITMGSDHFTKFTSAGFFQVQSGRLVRMSPLPPA